MKQFPMIMIGRLSRVLVILILCLGQVACSKASQSIPQSTSGEENVVITFADFESNRSLYEPLMEEFHKQNPSIFVQFVALPNAASEGNTTANDHYRILASAADTSLALPGGSDVSGYFRDLGPQIERDQSFMPDDFWQDALTACQDGNGHTWGVPINLFLSGIYYDEQAFTKAGLPNPKPGWTWDDFRRDITSLATQEGDLVRYGYADSPYGSLYSILTPTLGISLAATSGEIDVKSLTNVSKWYLDMAKAKILYPITGFDNAKTADDHWKALFKTNQPPAMWSGSLAWPIPGDAAGASFAIDKYGFAPFPVGVDGTDSKTTPVLAQCAVISASSAHPAATWAWISFLSKHWLIRDKTNLNELALMPARQSVADVDGLWTNLPIKAQPAVRYGLEHGYYFGLYQMTEGVVGAALEKAAIGQIDFTAALAEAKAKMATSPQPAASNTAVAVATPIPTQDFSANTTVVRFFNVYEPIETTALEKLAKQFNQLHPDIVVKISNEWPLSSTEGYYATFAKNFDCFIGQNDPIGAATSGQIFNLNGLLEAEDSNFRQDFDPSLLDASRYHGELLDLPFTTQPFLMSYNIDLLVKQGLQPPSNDWTFNEFLHLMQTAVSTSGDNKSYGYIGGGNLNIYEMLLASRNVRWLDLTGNLPVVELDSPMTEDAFAWLASLSKSNVLYHDNLPQVTEADRESAWLKITNTFSSGQVAFWDSRPGETDGSGIFMTPGDKPSFKTGVVPLPVMPDGSGSFQGSYDRGVYISRQTKNPQACWLWIKFLSDQSAAFHGVPARKSLASSSAWEASVGIEAANLYRLAAARVKRDTDVTLSNTNEIIKMPLETWEWQALDDVFNGSDPKMVLTEAQRKADVYLACFQMVDTSKLSTIEIQGKVKTCAMQTDPQGNW